jgi:hypothetical protein
MKKNYDNIKISIFKIEKIQSLLNIFVFLDFFTLSSLYFVNKYLRKFIRKKYEKRITMILYSLKIYKKFIKINCQNDFKILLMNNAEVITRFIKPLIINALTDYYYKIPVLKYYFNKIEKKQLEEVICKRLNLAKKSIKYLSYYLEDNLIVKNLNLSKNNLLGDVLNPLVNVIRTALNLSIVKLNNCQLDYSSLCALDMILNKDCPISQLELKSCDLNDSSIAQLNGSCKLRSLNLFDNKISSIGVLHICKNFKQLKELNLGKNNLDNKSSMFLYLYLKEKDNTLEFLDLQHNYLSKEGILIFIDNTCKIKILRELNLSYNFNWDFDLGILIFSPVINLRMSGYTISLKSNIILEKKNLLHMKELDLSDSKFDYTYANEYLKILTNSLSLDSLNLSNCYLNQSTFLANLPKYLNNKQNTISNLNISNNYLYKINPLLIIDILQLDNLISLDLSSNSLNLWGDDFIKLFGLSLAALKILKKINLNNNNLSDQLPYIYKSLSYNIYLETLLLDSNNINSKQNFQSLIQYLKASKLSLLTLKNNNITDEIIPIFLDFLDSLNGEKKTFLLINLNHNKFNYEGLKTIIDYFKFLNVDLNIQLKLSTYNLIDSYVRQESSELINYNVTGNIKNNIIL